MTLNKNSNLFYFCSFFIIWFVTFCIEYLYRDSIPLFICNDSYQYLDIAQNIYLNKQSNGLIKFALNLYYDEIAHFKYDFGNLKPYHFPSYSYYLSLFYHIYNNNNFVIYFSQYIAFIIFSIASFLIVNQYLNKKTSFWLVILSMFTTSVILYISDSGKEIIFSGLSLLAFYFGIYSPNRQKILTQILLCLILTFMSITRSFYLLEAFIIVLYNNFSFKYLERNPLIFTKIISKILNIFLIFIIPLLTYFYCYYYLQHHMFIYDNRTDIYGGKTFDDIILRFFLNAIFNYFWIFLHFIQRFNDFNDLSTTFDFYHLSIPWFISITGSITWLISKLKNLLNRKINIEKLDLIFLFNLILIISISIRFSPNGYRLTMSFVPIVFMYFYLNFIILNKYKILLYGFLLVNFIYLIDSQILYNKINAQNIDRNEKIKEIIYKFNAKKVVVGAMLFPHQFLLPLYHNYPDDIYFFHHFNSANLCDDLQNYSQHNINFDILIIGYEEKLFKNFKKDNCKFIIENFYVIDINEYGLTYINKDKIRSSAILKNQKI